MPAVLSKSSDRKRAANRQNASKSTGPKTVAGKTRSSRNALRHGFYGQSVGVGEVETKQFHLYCDSLIRSLNPRDAVEYSQVERIASLQWRIDRLQKAEQALIEAEQMRVFKSIHDSVKSLEQDRIEDQDYPPEERIFTQADADRIELMTGLYKSSDDVDPGHALMTLVSGDQSVALERVSRLEQRLDTQLQRAWKQLRELQDPEREIGGTPNGIVGKMECENQSENQNDETRNQNQVPMAEVRTESARNEATESAKVEDTTSCEPLDRGTAGSAVTDCEPAAGQSAGQSSLNSQSPQRPRE